MTNYVVKLLFIFWLMGSASVYAEADPEAGKTQYSLCAACHGANGEGNPVMKAPKLAGLSTDYLVKQLMNFRQGIRGTHAEDVAGMQMKSAADSLTDTQAVEDVASYVGSLADVDISSTLKGEAANGKMYWVVCSGCHGVNGLGNPALGAPRLQGMSDWYLVQQLKNYKSGLRGSHPEDKLGQQMIGMANMLPDDKSIVDLITYIRTLNPDPGGSH